MTLTKVKRIDDLFVKNIYTDGSEQVHRIDNPSTYLDDLNEFISGGGAVEPADPWEPTLAQAQARRTKEIRIEARRILSADTDWYIIRKYEAGTAVPAAVTSYRADVRQAAQSAATAINALTTIEAVRNYQPQWPMAPGE